MRLSTNQILAAYLIALAEGRTFRCPYMGICNAVKDFFYTYEDEDVASDAGLRFLFARNAALAACSETESRHYPIPGPYGLDPRDAYDTAGFAHTMWVGVYGDMRRAFALKMARWLVENDDGHN